MNPDYIEVSPEYYITKDYLNDDDLQVENLTEVYITVFTLERKGKEPEEVYSFTTDFEQAFKRFKLLPNSQGLLKRVLTDDPSLIKLAEEGTKPKPDPELARTTESLN